jgi:hypothetical protein
MILKEEEYYKFMEAFRKRALDAGINGGAINRIIASVPQAKEYDLNAIYRSLIVKAISLGVDENLFTTILAEATNDRENELYGTGMVEKHQEVYGVAPVVGPTKVVEKHQEVYGVAPVEEHIVVSPQLVYGTPTLKNVDEFTEIQAVYGPAQPSRRR